MMLYQWKGDGVTCKLLLVYESLLGFLTVHQLGGLEKARNPSRDCLISRNLLVNYVMGFPPT